MTMQAFISPSLLPTCPSRNSYLPTSSSRRRKRNVPPIRSCAGSQQARPATSEHERYLRDVAHVSFPQGLLGLLQLLKNAGESLVQPGARGGLHPFLVPLSCTEGGVTTGLLRWPTAPTKMDLPIVRSIPGSLGLTLIAPSALAHVRRAHATADYSGRTDVAEEIRTLVPNGGMKAGEVAASGLGGLERFLVVHVGGFPDVYRGLAEFHLAKGDEKSALVTCERANVLFPGWASPHVFYARMLKKLGRDNEARDGARFALQMPLWTMGGTEEVHEMGRLAGYVDESSLEKIYKRLFEDTREKDIQEGKAPEQVALDRAAYYLDWAMTRGETSWDDVDLEKLAELYDEAKLEGVATFVRY